MLTWSGLRQVAEGMQAPSFLPHSLKSILYSLKEHGVGGGAGCDSEAISKARLR